MGNPVFGFFISGDKTEVFPGSRLYNLPLSGEKTGILTVGDYFSAAQLFLSKNDFLLLKSGLQSSCQSIFQTDQIRQIILFLEKHGAFYHPLKVQVSLSEGPDCFFVLNGAVSAQGLSLITAEYEIISDLNTAFLNRYLPQVSGHGFINTDKGRIGFFLGEWFDGFNEFHVTLKDNRQRTVIWESDGTCRYIPKNEAMKIYREISRILTYYYDIETFEQIFPWHHAAGDFIVKQGQKRLDVRLVTARGYSPVTPFGSGERDRQEYILPSLLFFFLNLSLRMRLDRVDGTGKTILLEEEVIRASIEGFLTALDEKSTLNDFGDVRKSFLGFQKQFSSRQNNEMLENIVDAYPFFSSENALIRKNLKSHCESLFSILTNI